MDTSPLICLQVTFGKSVNWVSSGFSTPALSESYVKKMDFILKPLFHISYSVAAQ